MHAHVHHALAILHYHDNIACSYVSLCPSTTTNKVRYNAVECSYVHCPISCLSFSVIFIPVQVIFIIGLICVQNVYTAIVILHWTMKATMIKALVTHIVKNPGELIVAILPYVTELAVYLCCVCICACIHATE